MMLGAFPTYCPPEQRIAEMAQCPSCQQAFFCGAGQHPDQPCWCSGLPPLAGASLAATAKCYCPACLERLLQAQAATTAQNPSP
ncbi:cysteine-rich CWC family protein [Collimonas humicola]|uniref:cysteine-rich CWC family protein n=1 Tax=Collimonas humicola TaxID=2825886 RepID=UPI001E2BFB78|nr:cysteine-rich CWC family protein [Collimonas humicola]